MASAPSEPHSVLGRVDRLCRLIAADDELAALQREAGADIGDVLALPQIAAVARLAQRLNIAVERAAIAASNDQDFDLWVRATPDGDEVALSLEMWLARPAAGSRLASLNLAAQPGGETEAVRHEWSADSELRITGLSPDLARVLGVDPAEAVGLSLTRVVQLVEAADGDMPLISALAARRDFSGQSARSRSNPDSQLWLNGAVETSEDGRFQGFRGQARLVGEQATTAAIGGGDLADHALDNVLRSPLDRIIAEAEQIVERGDGPLRSDYASYGNDIAAAARHLLSVVSAQGDDPEYGHGQIDLAALAAEALILVEPVAKEAGVTIELEAHTSLQAIGEERAVIQILVNLIGNAIRHSPPVGLVSLSLGHARNQAWVTVA
ncbi:MAG: PAS domain-containing sensor histidine kinase, partial [Sphingomicrobium sp.]